MSLNDDAGQPLLVGASSDGTSLQPASSNGMGSLSSAPPPQTFPPLSKKNGLGPHREIALANTVAEISDSSSEEGKMSSSFGISISGGKEHVSSSSAESQVPKGINSSESGSWNDEDVIFSGTKKKLHHATAAVMKKLGLFEGVFVPCVLSIFGVILFVRLPWIVGQGGLYLALLMLIIAYVVVTVTVLSLSAISSNGRMGGGGAYYLIARALGPEFGGAIGLIFYCANVFGCCVYLVGFADSFLEFFAGDIPSTSYAQFFATTIPLVVVTLICVVGAQLFAKTMMAVFVVMNFAIFWILIAMFVQPAGAFDGFTSFSIETFKANLSNHFGTPDEEGTTYNFFQVFAILFPAATGIMAGANMSGDLSRPSHAIPWGTLGALLFTGCTYIIFIVTVAFTIEPDRLLCVDSESSCLKDGGVSGYFVFQAVSWFEPIFAVGIWSATISSAMAVLIGAAKIAQALARDELLPFTGIFKKGYTVQDEPRVAVVFTGVLVQIVLVLITELNTLAIFQTLFFLLSYGIVNLACFLLAVNNAPNFRPTFRYYTWHTALFGVVLSVAVMFLSDPVSTGITIALLVILVLYIHQKGPPTTWGEISQSIVYHQVRKYLLRLDPRRDHIKFWRPGVLVLVNNPRSSHRRIQLANQLKKGGLLCTASMYKADFHQFDNLSEKLDVMNRAWFEYIATHKLKAFPYVVIADSVRQGVRNTLMTSGLGMLKPNSVLLGFYEGKNDTPLETADELHHLLPAKRELLKDSLKSFPPLRDPNSESPLEPEDYVGIMHDVLSLGKNLILTRNLNKLPYQLLDDVLRARDIFGRLTDKGDKKNRTIDVWLLPNFDSYSINMCMFMGFILSSHRRWHYDTSLRFLSIVPPETPLQTEHVRLAGLADEYRLPCTDYRVYHMNHFLNPEDNLSRYIQSVPALYRLYNRIMRHAIEDDTAITFVPLPAPPRSESANDRAVCVEYLEHLDILSQHLPPTVMVHANRTVMTVDV